MDKLTKDNLKNFGITGGIVVGVVALAEKLFGGKSMRDNPEMKIDKDYIYDQVNYLDWKWQYSGSDVGAKEAAEWLENHQFGKKFIYGIVNRYEDEIIDAYKYERPGTNQSLDEFALDYLQDIIAQEKLDHRKGNYRVDGSVSFELY